MLNELVESLVHELCDRLAVTAGIAETAKGMSIAFTSERGRIERDYFADESSPDAYIAAFLVPNAAKTIQCLLEMDAMGLIPRKEAVDVLDIGTGPGTSILAASIFFSRRYPDTAVRFAGIERSREALLAAHELFKIIAPPNHHFESATKEISPGELKAIMRGHRFDISIAANVLNELSSDDACDLCQDIISDHLADSGALLVIDPALKETARPLMGIRDRLVSENLSVAAPCLSQGSCPMLAANDRDWCHFYIDWKCPEYLSELDRLSGMNHKHLKMSYFVFTRESRVTSHESRKWRVVSSPLVSKGKRELMLCGENGKLMKAARLDRDASDKNADLARAKRGDIVRCGYKKRISMDDSLSIEIPWDR